MVRERSLIPDSLRIPCGTADTEVVVVVVGGGRGRIGRRTRRNARLNQRRMDHPLLSARSQPPSPSRQITTSLPAPFWTTKSSRSLPASNTALLVSLPCPISLVTLAAAGGTKIKIYTLRYKLPRKLGASWFPLFDQEKVSPPQFEDSRFFLYCKLSPAA